MGHCRYDKGPALQVVASMRDDFEFHGQGAFEPDQVHFQQDAVFLTDQMTVEPLAKDSLERRAWQSTWQAAGWLRHNPLVSVRHNIDSHHHSSSNKSPTLNHEVTIMTVTQLRSQPEPEKNLITVIFTLVHAVIRAANTLF